MSHGPCLCGDPYCPACFGHSFDDEDCPICKKPTDDGDHTECLAVIRQRELEAEEAIAEIMREDEYLDIEDSIFDEGMRQSEQSAVENGF